MSQTPIHILAKLCRPHSGQAAKYAIDNATPKTIEDMLLIQGAPVRLMDASDLAALDDKLATVITGLENFSEQQMKDFLNQLVYLRFRNLLIFPTKLWFQGEETAWDRWGESVRERLKNAVTMLDLEEF